MYGHDSQVNPKTTISSTEKPGTTFYLRPCYISGSDGAYWAAYDTATGKLLLENDDKTELLAAMQTLYPQYAAFGTLSDIQERY